MIATIVSGGQTGVDRAALEAARDLGLACGGWCPRGRRAEDGAIDARYPLRETPSEDYAQRTEWNVRDSDGTLVITRGRPAGGTALTVAVARRLRKPLLVVDLEDPGPARSVRDWADRLGIGTLNVAGPRESQQPGIEAEARQLLLAAFGPAAADL